MSYLELLKTLDKGQCKKNTPVYASSKPTKPPQGEDAHPRKVGFGSFDSAKPDPCFEIAEKAGYFDPVAFTKALEGELIPCPKHNWNWLYKKWCAIRCTAKHSDCIHEVYNGQATCKYPA